MTYHFSFYSNFMLIKEKWKEKKENIKTINNNYDLYS